MNEQVSPEIETKLSIPCYEYNAVTNEFSECRLFINSAHPPMGPVIPISQEGIPSNHFGHAHQVMLLSGAAQTAYAIVRNDKVPTMRGLYMRQVVLL